VTATRDRSPAADNADALRRLGHLVRARRRTLGYTLADVADRTGLSVPFLSQVENGVGTPSLTSLFALARVLDTTAEALLAGPPIEPVVVVPADGGTRYPLSDDGSSSQRRQLTTVGEPFSAAEYVVEPGTDLGGFEASAGRDLLHVLDGALSVEVRCEGAVERHDIGAGDTIIYDAADPHRWSTSGRTTTRFLHVISASPGTGHH
jgi:transcriptional regulator with XRE-family HTH domain